MPGTNRWLRPGSSLAKEAQQFGIDFLCVGPGDAAWTAFHDVQTSAFDELGGALSGRTDQLALRSEEHTSELQSRLHLVCRLLLEKKKNNNTHNKSTYLITERSIALFHVSDSRA